MSVYLGSLGRLVELVCPSSDAHAPDDPVRVEVTAEGKRVAYVQELRPRRSWSLDVSGSPRELASLSGFTSGEWGKGPFVWVPTDAPVLNMLTPGEASSDPVRASGTITAAGPLLTPDGFAGRSFLNSNTANVFYFSDKTPVIAGQQVTASVYLLGAGAKCRIAWHDVSGALISFQDSTVAATAGSVVRCPVTATAPVNAAYCRVGASGMVQGARPAITWTSQLFDWYEGQGCPKAIIREPSREVVLAFRDPGYGRRSNMHYTITEVG